MIHTEDKPPLTRRWTSHCRDRCTGAMQTSAHAEMDPLRSRCVTRLKTNLRSRGDGPSKCIVCVIFLVKPPLTRRWTRRGRPDGHHEQQTSAHAEMDPVSWTACRIGSANLRSRGDGPGRADGACPQRSKPPHTRRWAPKSDGRTCGLTLRTYPPVVVSYDSSLNVDVGNRCPWQRKWIRNRGQLSQAHFCELLADV